LNAPESPSPLDRTAAPSGTLWLEAPDWRALDTLAQRAKPWVLWRIGFQSLLAHWMDESVRRNVATVVIICPDRLAEVEAALHGAVYWSREVQFCPTAPAEAPAKRESLIGLPGLPGSTPPSDGPSLVRHWLDLQLAWLASRGERVSVDRQLHPRVWVGPGVRIHPAARLTGPCWIGSRSEIGADTAIGPNAIIGSHCVIDQHASVIDSVVLPDTYVGLRLHLRRMLADGNILLDTTRDTRVDMTDRFMLGRLHQGWSGWFRRRPAKS
jgi:hypothetical protein